MPQILFWNPFCSCGFSHELHLTCGNFRWRISLLCICRLHLVRLLSRICMIWKHQSVLFLRRETCSQSQQSNLCSGLLGKSCYRRTDCCCTKHGDGGWLFLEILPLSVAERKPQVRKGPARKTCHHWPLSCHKLPEKLQACWQQFRPAAFSEETRRHCSDAATQQEVNNNDWTAGLQSWIKNRVKSDLKRFCCYKLHFMTFEFPVYHTCTLCLNTHADAHTHSCKCTCECSWIQEAQRLQSWEENRWI